jgi:hypothetical protein
LSFSDVSGRVDSPTGAAFHCTVRQRMVRIVRMVRRRMVR